ncbi:Zinc finger protein [Wickerhamomyces ciferrii]|uniref:Zinc finger protein n=1 Tax=Wickerhamomyces ciferrii (strain ATCC 14091 / BCRC 22168 / CBS 111 / JCM 3599 / NBRC 0793 / NRRL Y-1031 F-60-10) TaxID=1206466 RepID=K0KMP2_WICCF|nr:Zinc finger protein [Wickerhamomyces ciferrii]CCH46550.1 Zinc finger protein [Wickerhamomyces ciferrii]
MSIKMEHGSSSESQDLISNDQLQNLSNDGEGSISDSSNKQRKRKKRQTGVFNCDFEGCDKVFSRAEHLARHKLNHNPTVIYHCPWDNCEKSFVRKDLLERHSKRHEVRKAKEEAKARERANNTDNKRKRRKRTTDDDGVTAMKNENESSLPKIPINSLDSIILPNVVDESRVDIHDYGNESHLSAANPELNALQDGPITTTDATTLLTERNHQMHRHHSHNPHSHISPTLTMSPQSMRSLSAGAVPSSDHLNPPASPSNLINWLFDDNNPAKIGNLETLPNFSGDNFFNPNDDPFGLSSNLLDDILQIPPNFPNPAQQTSITPEIRQVLINLVPRIAYHDYLQYLEKFMDLYWTCFHIQYPIIHRPSFNTATCPPILLLSMIMTGASYATAEPSSTFTRDPREFADLIAEPLRLIIFSSDEFHPPSEIHIIQSLLLLECYERFASNRKLHERAFLHHGTTIQLLRRSPGMGGNPLKNKTDYHRNKNATIWEKWIEFESVKRSTLFAFYIDSTHSIVFGYQLMLFSNHVQLDLPCDDELWESYLTPTEIPNRNDSLPFLVGLKKVLNREPVKTSKFGKKILMSGLLTVMSQMQQRDLQGSILETEQLRDSWKETLSLAFDYWNCDIMEGCCNTESAYLLKDQSLKSIRPYSLTTDDTKCKIPVYHMAQITLRVQHYDYFVYAGAPWRMNVYAEPSDYELVEKKIREWANSSAGKISVIYGYLFLFEMFLTPQDVPIQSNLEYSPETDAILNRLNVLALVTLLIWSYNYNLDGPESKLLEEDPEGKWPEYSSENGYDHLRRIRDQLTKLTGKKVHTIAHQDSVHFHNAMLQQASKLDLVPKKHHMTGLLGMISQSFSKCYWEVGVEFSRLISNCRRRSFGSPKVRCDNMYSTQL